MRRAKYVEWIDTCKPESSCSANSGGQEAVTDQSWRGWVLGRVTKPPRLTHRKSSLNSESIKVVICCFILLNPSKLSSWSVQC